MTNQMPAQNIIASVNHVKTQLNAFLVLKETSVFLRDAARDSSAVSL
jgi:hypothetical protein